MGEGGAATCAPTTCSTTGQDVKVYARLADSKIPKIEKYAESWSGNKYLQKEAQLFFLTSTQISVQVSHKPEAETEEKDTGTENTQRRTRMILRSLF